MNYTQKKEWQRHVRAMLQNRHDHFFVTAAFNRRSLSPEYARSQMKQFSARVERRMFGKRWASLPPSERLEWIALPEIANDKLHYHLLVTIPDTYRREQFRLIAPRIFRDLTRSGDLDIQTIDSPSDRDRVASYITKEAWEQLAVDHMIISTEFHGKSTKPRATPTDDVLMSISFELRSNSSGEAVSRNIKNSMDYGPQGTQESPEHNEVQANKPREELLSSNAQLVAECEARSIDEAKRSQSHDGLEGTNNKPFEDVRLERLFANLMETSL